MPAKRSPTALARPRHQQQLLPLAPAKPPASVRWTAEGLVEDWLHTRQSPKTAKVYREDLSGLAMFLGCEPAEAAAALLKGRAAAEQVLEHWDRWNRDCRGLAPYSRARRIWAMGSFVKHACRREVVHYSVSVKTPKLIPRRDTAGPDPDRLTKALRLLAEEPDTMALRDAAIMHLMFACGLRQGEVLSMRLRDCDLTRQRLMVVSKGRLGLVPARGVDGRLIDPSAQEPDREAIDGVPRPVWRVLKRWVREVHRLRPTIHRDAPLWWSLAFGKYLNRKMGHRGITMMLRRRLKAAGLPVCTSHGMRHSAITCCLDRSGGNLRLVQGFARHADLRQLARYDDARLALFGEGAKLVARGLK